MASKGPHFIISETRRSIVDAILATGNFARDKQYHEFAKIVCPSLAEGTISEIARHMDRFDDWPQSYLRWSPYTGVNSGEPGGCLWYHEVRNKNDMEDRHHGSGQSYTGQRSFERAVYSRRQG